MKLKSISSFSLLPSKKEISSARIKRIANSFLIYPVSVSYTHLDVYKRQVCIGYMICKKYGVDTQNFAINRIPEGLASKEPKEIREMCIRDSAGGCRRGY